MVLLLFVVHFALRGRFLLLLHGFVFLFSLTNNLNFIWLLSSGLKWFVLMVVLLFVVYFALRGRFLLLHGFVFYFLLGIILISSDWYLLAWNVCLEPNTPTRANWPSQNPQSMLTGWRTETLSREQRIEQLGSTAAINWGSRSLKIILLNICTCGPRSFALLRFGPQASK